MRCKNCIWFFISYVLEYYCKRYKRYKCSVSLLRRIVLTVENYVTEKNVRIYQCLFAKHVVHNNWQYLNTRAARAYTGGGANYTHVGVPECLSRTDVRSPEVLRASVENPAANVSPRVLATETPSCPAREQPIVT